MDWVEDKLTDEEIVLKVQSGKVEPFGILIERYEAKMGRYARRFLFGHEDTKDIIQEVFLKAFINIKSFDTSRKFSPWLYRVAHNEFINAIKKKKKEPLPFFNIDVILPHFISGERTEKKAEERETAELIKGNLDKLAPKYREPLVLYYFEDLSYKEIADVLKVPISTVGVRVKRGKEMIKSFIHEKYER